MTFDPFTNQYVYPVSGGGSGTQPGSMGYGQTYAPPAGGGTSYGI
jgi:hypothetical protein